MSLAELIILLNLLLKFAVVVADNDDKKYDVISVSRQVADKLENGWGTVDNEPDAHDIPF